MSVFLSSGSPTRSVPMRRCSARDDLVVDRLLHEQPGARAADVALVEEDAVDDALDGLVDRGVVEDDVRRLAAELQRQLLAGAGDGAGDLLADGGGAGEGHLVDAGVLDDRAAGLAGAGDDVDHARRAGRPGWQISAKSSAVSGVVSAGLRTTVLPAASAGAIFQASISSGKFQGMTWPATPSGRGRGAEARVVELVGPARVVEEVRRGEGDVDVAGLADRLAVVQGLQDGELARALLQQPGDAEEVLAAVGRAHRAPESGERAAGGARRRGRRRPRCRRRPR